MPLQLFNPKGEMVFPLQQHIGKPAKPVVKKNDPVLVGQTIAEADGFVSAPVVSSCSGTVKAIEKRRTLMGTMAECIIVENDGQFRTVEGMGIKEDISGLSHAEILKRIQDAGIVGLGGAGFPTHVKLMRSSAAEILQGLALVLNLFPNAEGVIGIEDNKPEAIAAMKAEADKHAKMRVIALQTKYPQGGEKSLVKVVTGIDLPMQNLPADAGCIVVNVGTLFAIYRAVVYREPLFSQVFTLTGDAVAKPGNYIVRDGTSFAELLEAAGGLKPGVTLKKALVGGPMMGIALADLNVPIQKQNNGLTLLGNDPVEEAEKLQTACLHCGRCTTVCPVGLMPQLMSDAAELKDYQRYEVKLHGLECVQCGSCTYACPAKRPLMQVFKQAKAEIMAMKKREGGSQK